MPNCGKLEVLRTAGLRILTSSSELEETASSVSVPRGVVILLWLFRRGSHEWCELDVRGLWVSYMLVTIKAGLCGFKEPASEVCRVRVEVKL